MNVIIRHGLSEEERAAAATVHARIATLMGDLNALAVDAEVTIAVTMELTVIKPPADTPTYDARPPSVIGPN